MIHLCSLVCDNCGQTAIIQPDVLRGIKGDITSVVKAEPFVDFVCAQCGFGSRRLLSSIPESQFESPPTSAIRYVRDLFHESLRCKTEGCAAHARVHTIRDNSTSDDMPIKPVAEWKLSGITCSLGHPVDFRPTPLPSRFP